MSIPRPPPSSACTSDSSTTTVLAWLCDVTASRNLKAASLRTILPSHSTIARSPMLSILSLSMASSGAFTSTNCAIPYFVYVTVLYEPWHWKFWQEASKSALPERLYSLLYGNVGLATELTSQWTRHRSERQWRTTVLPTVFATQVSIQMLLDGLRAIYPRPSKEIYWELPCTLSARIVLLSLSYVPVTTTLCPAYCNAFCWSSS